MAKGKPLLPHLPDLNAEELDLLRRAAYDTPVVVANAKEATLAGNLVLLGLVESTVDFGGAMRIRQTMLGAQAHPCLTPNRAERVITEIRRLAPLDDEAAANLERRLWQRVLVETTLGAPLGSPDINAPTLAKVALKSARIEFRRG